ncbi:MAG: hypothetical protein GTN97_03340 [Nitrosopumilaceae archaeon]|nr:hypothetical protein [Nitrosopumilaceae archaeon]
MVNGNGSRRVLNIPKGRASALPKGSAVRQGLRGKKPLAQRIVRSTRIAQATGRGQQTLGVRRQNRRTARNISSNLLGFRMDGRGRP